MSFSSLPYFVAQPYARQKILNSINQAYTGVRRWLMLGDSQETAPGGSGSVYIPAINQAFQSYYGNRCETRWLPQSSFGGGAPVAVFLARGNISGGAQVSTTDQLLPGFVTRSYVNADNGPLWMQLPDASLVGTNFPSRQWYQDVTGDLDIDFLFQRDTSGGAEAQLIFNTLATNATNYFAAGPTLTTTSGWALNAANDYIVRTQRYTQHATNHYAQIAIRSATSTPIRITSARFRHANARGIALTPAGAGGYQVTNVLASHANAGRATAAMGPFDLVILQFGANDSGNNVTPDQYRTNLQTLIATLRTWLGADQTFLIVPDVARTALTTQQQTNLSDYNLAAKQLTDLDANVAFLNLRRLTNDRLGWTSAGGSFLLDNVHLTTEAQILEANTVVTSLMSIGDSDNAAVLNKLNEIQIDVRNLTP